MKKMIKMKRIMAYVVTLLLTAQCTIGLFAGNTAEPQIAKAASYYKGDKAYIEDLAVGDIIVSGAILTLREKQLAYIYIDKTKVKNYTLKNNIVTLPSQYNNVNFIITRYVPTPTNVGLYLETYKESVDMLDDTSFQDLINSNSEVTLDGMVVLDNPAVIDDGRKHTIDLNGNDIKRTGLNNPVADGSVFIVKNYSTLVIKDSSKETTPGEIRGGYAAKGGGILLEGYSDLVMENVGIKENRATKGGGIYVSKG